MYIDNKELLPCNKCGLRFKYIQQLNSGSVLSLRCGCCGRSVNSSDWGELKEKWNNMNGCSQISEVCSDSAFHIHTYRCKHASEEDDELYIRKAIELGVKRIIFTDHAPFPGNPFGNRMDYEQLPEYISTFNRLKEKYKKRIVVQIGLEIEYLPSYRDYYYDLAEMKELQWLILGQHMYEYEPGVYSFNDTEEVKNQTEYIGLCDAMIEGMKTGLFRVVAHPDRAFRRRKIWDDSMAEISRRLIDTAIETGTVLEKNVSSLRRNHQYWPEFWELLDEILSEDKTKKVFWIKGLDAHSVEEMEYDTIYQRQ